MNDKIYLLNKNHPRYHEIKKKSPKEEIKDLYKEFSKDLKKYSIDSILFASEMIAKYDEFNKQILTNDELTDTNVIKEGNYWWKFAASTFGWQYNLAYRLRHGIGGFIKHIFKNKNNLNSYLTAQYCGISTNDIIVASWKSKLMTPGYFLAVDHKTQSIVLAIRGSFEIKDAIPDLIANKTEFLEGSTHNGLLRASLNVKKEIDENFKQLKNKYPNYQIILTGHSLGAAVAAIITTLLLEEYAQNIKLHAYCFACPAIFTYDLALQYKNYITTFIYNDDCIPRLSYDSMETLKHKIINVINHNKSFKLRIVQTLIKWGFCSENSFPNIKPVICLQKINFEEPEIILNLLPPGQIIYMYKDDDNKLKIEKSCQNLFSHVVVSQRMLFDHFPDEYEKVLNEANAQYW